MLDKLSLQNFKAFKELNDLEFKPITVLCGTNSCGKSSILQSLLLFKQTIESQGSKRFLQNNGKLVRFGRPENIFFRKKLNDGLTIKFSTNFIPKDFYPMDGIELSLINRMPGLTAGLIMSGSITSIMRDIGISIPTDKNEAFKFLSSRFHLEYSLKLKVINQNKNSIKNKESSITLVPGEINFSIYQCDHEEGKRNNQNFASSDISKARKYQYPLKGENPSDFRDRLKRENPSDFRDRLSSSFPKPLCRTLTPSSKKKVEINLSYLGDNDYKTYEMIYWSNDNNVINEEEREFCEEQSAVASVEFINLFPASFRVVSLKGKVERDYRAHSYDVLAFSKERELLRKLYKMSDLLRLLFSSYNYIGPLREQPQRQYVYEDEINDVGYRGENAAYLYSTEKDNVVSNACFYDDQEEQFISSSRSLTVAECVRKWFEFLGISRFNTDSDSGEVISLNLGADPFSSTVVNIADVGFGVSQVFPILLEGIRMNKGGTLLLEQPEIHLHPKMQMQMADFFISLALSGKNIIIETHSDHMINRLIRRIVEDDSLNLKDLIKIYFVKQSEDGSFCEEIQIDDSMGIVNWPDGFFDQAASEQQKILMAGIKKRKARRNKEAEQS